MGPCRSLCRNGAGQGWTLRTSGCGLQETLRNLPKMGPAAAVTWEAEIQPILQLVPDALARGERALVFPQAKDCPVVLAALAAEGRRPGADAGPDGFSRSVGAGNLWDEDPDSGGFIDGTAENGSAVEE